jgi:predicted TIM-barrel fold metal-dependent hydrolase
MFSSARVDRRRFFEGIAACGAYSLGLAPAVGRAAGEQPSLVDTHVYVDHWPLRQLAASPDTLQSQIRAASVSQAWVGSLDGLFHKDMHAVNARLVELCGGNASLVPVGSVNPTLPDWEEDLRRCSDVFKMRAVRLHPNYHGHALNDSRFVRLLKLAADRKLVVQIVTLWTGEPHRLLTPRESRVDLRPLGEIVKPLPNLRLLMTNGDAPAQDAATNGLLRMANVWFGVGKSASGEQFGNAVRSLPPDRIVFGSTAPFNSMTASLEGLTRSGLSEEQLRAIRAENASRLLSS